MSLDAPSPAQTPQGDAPPSPAASEVDSPQDWARPLLERQLWILGQLAEGGLEIARSIERQATDEGSDPAVRAAAPMAYARVARAVRMTILLQSRLIEDLRTLESKAAHEASCARIRQDAARPGLARAQKARIGRIVGRVAWADGEDLDKAERLAREAGERLDQDDIYGDVLSRPISELVAEICQDLGLEPDWPALAEQAWARAEIESGAPGSPLAAVMDEGPDARRPAPVPEHFAPCAASP